MNKLKEFWKYFWHGDSLGSWLLNIVVFFLLIRFVFYPLLGIVLGTSFPIVAVVSESMEHGLHNEIICGQRLDDFRHSFENYWQYCGAWYENNNISQQEFRQFPLSNGFDKGDVIVLWRPTNIEVGDILIFKANKAQPIIHRVVRTWQEGEETFYQTKGDHNQDSIGGGLGETKIATNRLYGKAILRVPYFGWVKILFVDIVSIFGIVIER